MSEQTLENPPLIQEEEPTTTILASFAIAWDTVKAISLFVSSDETRYVLNGVCFEIHPDCVILISTDGRRMAAFRAPMEFLTFTEPFEAIMSRDLISKVKLGRQTLPAKITIQKCRGKVIFRVSDALDSIAFENPAVDGNYPRWRKVTPDGFMTQDVHVCVNPEFLADFAKAQGLIGSTSGLRLLCPEGHKKLKAPYIVDIGAPEFLGVLMPMRGDEERYSYNPRQWAKPEPVEATNP